MKKWLEMAGLTFGLSLLGMLGVAALFILIAGVMLALASPLILIVWLILHSIFS